MTLVYAGQIAWKWLFEERQYRLPIDGEMRAGVRVHTGRNQTKLTKSDD